MLRRTPWTPALLLLGYGVVLALTCTRHVTEDSIKYVRDSLAGGAALFHPHHILYHGLMHGVVRAVGLGLPEIDRSMRAMQLANVAISVAALYLFFCTCRQLGARTRVATVFALAFALASAFFQFASQVEVYNGMALFSCMAILGLAMPVDRPGRGWLVGLGYFFAMGFHQVGIFLGIAIAVHEWPRHHDRRRWLGLASCLGLPLVAMGGVYALLGTLLGYRSPAGLWEWITLYGHLPYWGLGRVDAVTARNLAVGAGKSLVDTTFLPNWILAVTALGLAAFIVLHLPALPRSGPRARLLPALVAWLAGYGLFMTWWDAANVESWIVMSVAFFLVLACLATGDAAAALPLGSRRAAWAGLGMCIVLMGVADTVYLQHDRRPNLAQEAARLLRSVAAPGDLVIAIDTDKGAYYDLYLCGQGVSVEPINFDIAQAAAERRENQSFTAAVIDELARRVRAAGARGRRCYVDAWVERGAIAPIRDMRDIDVQEFRRLLAATFALQPLDSGTPQLAFAVTAAPTAAPLP